ncbi:MAG TPA: sulfatase-like hydrolase/transferase [Actinomycetota bacterium]
MTNRLAYLPLSGLLAATALTLSTMSFDIEPALAAAKPPNILIIVTDDQRAAGTLEVQPTVRSWLSGDGTTFTNAYATTPLCCPSRASIITGLYAHNHGITGDGNNSGKLHAVDAMSVLPSFQAAGYTTGLYGKYLNSWGLNDDGTMDPGAWRPTGVDDYALVPSVRGWYEDMKTDGAARWDVNGTVTRSPLYSTTFIGSSVQSFIQANDAANDAEPWLAYVAPIVPHAPATPDAIYAEAPTPEWRLTPAQAEDARSDKPAWLRNTPPAGVGYVRSLRTRHLRSLMSVDDLVSDIRSTLVELDEHDDTIVIYTSDNGFAWGEHGRIGKGTPYLESVKVPLYIRGPGIGAGKVREDIVALLDLAPTLLAAAAIQFPREFDGHDLFDGYVRQRLLLEIDSRPGNHVPSWRAVLSTRNGSVTPAYEFIRYLDDDGSRLANEAYDLVDDRWQLSNLYRTRTYPPKPDPWLSELMTCQGAACALAEGR